MRGCRAELRLYKIYIRYRYRVLLVKLHFASLRRLLIAWKVNESEVEVLDRIEYSTQGVTSSAHFRLGDSTRVRFGSTRVESMAKFVISYLH